MQGLAQFCVRRRRWVVSLWLLTLVGLGTLVGVAGSSFSDSTNLPDSDSSTAYALLGKAGSDAASVTTGTIVWKVDNGSALDARSRQTIEPMLGKVGAVDGVAQVVDPFTSAGAAQVSTDGRTAYATVVFSSDDNSAQVKELADAADSGTVDVHIGGAAYANSIPSEISEIIGVLAALLILILVFRSMWAAVLPIITGVAGVGVSTLAVLLLSHAINIADVALSLGALIGLGVGIDYALFIVNRYRRSLREGSDVSSAVATALSTSGRSVVFAGATVIIALLGMLVLGIGFLTGMAISAAITVALTVAAATTLLPALLGMLGRKVLRRSDRTAPALTTAADVDPLRRKGLGVRWARLVRRRPVVTSVSALVLMFLVAAPALSLRLGASDPSSDPEGSYKRTYYDTMARSFGDGFQAQLLLVAETPDASSRQAWTKFVATLPSVPDVASVGASSAVGSDRVQTVTIIPASTAQAESTSALVKNLRSDYIHKAEAGNDLQVHVGGTTATTIDFADALTSKLPLFLVIIAGLGFILLVLAFRSLLVPLIGALGNLLTIAVALGSTVALFQWGWGPTAFGIGGGAPLEYIVAILMVGVVFGLSMDYHVFLVSRMHEEWEHTHDHTRAVTGGAADTARVIATAAGIMAVVFASFGFAGVRTTSEFGVGLAIAVLADAFLLRLTVIPALMHLIGRRTWSLPGWLDAVLPHVSIEGPGTPLPDRSTTRV